MGISAWQFFFALYEGVGAGWIEIRPLLDDDDPRKGTDEGKRQEWQWRRWFTWPAQLGHCVKYCASINGQAHVYFGVGLRKNDKSGKKDDVGCCTAVFCDVDHKDVPLEALRKLIHDFPLKPSAILRSGHGGHLYWLLKEPVMASGFAKLEAVNRAMLKYFGAQVGPQDVSRILRIPGTLNIKKKYPDPKPVVEISYWHPEKRYTLDDFEDLLAIEEPAAAVPPPRAANPAPAASAPQTGQPANPQPHKIPCLTVPDEQIEELAGLFSELWFDGHRHFFALHIAGMCAHKLFLEASALKLIDRICQLTNDTQAADRRTTVTDTYRKYVSGNKTAGLKAYEKELQRQIEQSIPKGLSASEAEGVRQKRFKDAHDAVKAFEKIATKLNKADEKAQKKRGSSDGEGPTRKKAEPNFHLPRKVIKFDSRPARYNAALVLNNNGGHEYVATAERPEFWNFNKFKELVFEQQDIVLASIRQVDWENMIAAAGIDIKEAPKEARPEGVIDEALEELLQDAKEDPEAGLLRSFAGIDETSIFFRYAAFKNVLVDKGHRFSDQFVYERLKLLGWAAKKRRFGKKSLNVWFKAVSEHNPGGPQPVGVVGPPPGPPPEKPKEPTGELWDAPGGPDGPKT